MQNISVAAFVSKYCQYVFQLNFGNMIDQQNCHAGVWVKL